MRGTGLTVWPCITAGLVVLVEELAASAERAVEAKLTGKALEEYRAAGIYEA